VEIDLQVGENQITGHCDPQFQPVLDSFIDNFETKDELGASVSLNIEGESTVNLWGGFVKPLKGTDERDDYRWNEDTLSVVFSCTKAATALCAHILIDQGKLNLHEKVSTYWPEFAANGKQDVTVEMILNHTAGLPALREPVKESGYLDWDYMVDRLANEAPFWEPGTRSGYHMTTYGWTVGELVKRVSGHSLGDFFQLMVAQPLGIEFWIGLPDEQHHRVSRMKQWVARSKAKLTPFTHKLLHDQKSIQFLALLNTGRHKTDSSESYRAEYGAGGGITNARNLAKMYTPLANMGLSHHHRLISNDQIHMMSKTSVATMRDATLLMPTRFSLGFMRSMDNRHRETGDMESCILGKDAFGHAGAGGSIGFADPEERLSFAYTMNRMGAGILLNERSQNLVDATYCSLGYSSNKSGMWLR
jgi:CubicO group peptidase (beta-lactamase class C family)